MKKSVNDLKVGDVIANVEHNGNEFNARVSEIIKVFDPFSLKPVNAVLVSIFCTRDDGAVYHISRKLPGDGEYEILYREDTSEDIFNTNWGEKN